MEPRAEGGDPGAQAVARLCQQVGRATLMGVFAYVSQVVLLPRVSVCGEPSAFSLGREVWSGDVAAHFRPKVAQRRTGRP